MSKCHRALGRAAELARGDRIRGPCGANSRWAGLTLDREQRVLCPTALVCFLQRFAIVLSASADGSLFAS